MITPGRTRITCVRAPFSGIVRVCRHSLLGKTLGIEEARMRTAVLHGQTRGE